MIKPPSDKVKIGYRDYIIEPMSLTQGTREDLYGQCDRGRGIIRICFEHDARSVGNTVLHEFMHAIYYEWSLADDDREERIITTMANGLATVWRDNPDWMNWIGKILK